MDDLEAKLENEPLVTKERARELRLNAREYVAIYTVAHEMGSSPEQYEKCQEVMDKFLVCKLLPSLDKAKLECELLSSSRSALAYLTEVRRQWSHYQVVYGLLDKIFTNNSLRWYIAKECKPKIPALGVNRYKALVFHSRKSETTCAVIQVIHNERNGETIDRELITNIMQIYKTMQQAGMEHGTNDIMLDATMEYYKSKSLGVWCSTQDYLAKLSQALEKEKERVDAYLSDTFKCDILAAAEEGMFLKFAELFREHEGARCQEMLEKDDLTPNLKTVVDVLAKWKYGLVSMAPIFRNHVAHQGKCCLDNFHGDVASTAIGKKTDKVGVRGNGKANGQQTEAKLQRKDDEDRFECLQTLLVLRKRQLEVIQRMFMDNSGFHKALHDAFVDILNMKCGDISLTELLCSFCDHVLKKGGGESRDTTKIQDVLNDIMSFFSYVTEKDLFIEAHQKLLAKRLLMHTATSIDSEKEFLGRLKAECGPDCTYKLERMMTDIVVNSELRSALEVEWKGHKTTLQFSAQVLTQNFWPAFVMPKARLTPEMSHCMGEFEQWYHKRHISKSVHMQNEQKQSNRKLRWVFSLGHATVQATFGNKTYDILVTTLQALALNAMNGGTVKTFRELSENLGLDEAIMKPLLHSLSCGKYQVLRKLSPGKKIFTTDSFSANEAFASNTRKFRIPMASLDARRSSAEVEDNRSVAIEAAIVRTIKAHKRMCHQDLVSQVLSSPGTLFRPDPRQIKQRIESLIYREFLERSKDDPSVYIYID